jgi:hypothetical protein
LSQNRKSAQKGVKRRQKAQKGDFMAEKGARMAPKGVNRRILTHFGELGKNIVFFNYFLIFFFIFIKSLKKVCFCSLNFHCFNLFVEFLTI